MNYHFISNNYEIVKYDFPDLFDVKIYYLNENYLTIDVKRLDSSDGWGLILKIKIYDMYDDTKYNIITFGNSNYNFKSNFFYTNIKLEFDVNKIPEIPTILYPRNEKLIKNNYNIIIEKNKKNIDIHYVIYYIDEYNIKIILRRLDEEHGWEHDLKLFIYDIDLKNRKDIINIGSSNINYKILFKNTKIKIFEDNDDYIQKIPKIIFQTGSNNYFKNVLHFNSIISFIELNPEYTYIYYDDVNARQFLRENFSEEINYSYDLLVPGAYKADLLRYCLLYNKGGCYFDCKQILKMPIKKFLDRNKSLVLCNDVIDKALLNAVIFSTKNNNIIEKTIKDCIYNIIHKLGTSPLDITGPIFFFKSIKNLINSDNLILQNNRPQHDFNDFCNDYYNNNITIKNDNKIILNRFYKGYYTDYLDTVHYGKLYNNNEIYYKNFQFINSSKICIYPNKFNDKFFFTLKDNNKLNIKRVDSSDGWHFNLKILLIDKNYKEHLITIGMSQKNNKDIEFNFDI
jgi:mannosyltransferase OCH1-like enzyme